MDAFASLSITKARVLNYLRWEQWPAPIGMKERVDRLRGGDEFEGAEGGHAHHLGDYRHFQLVGAGGELRGQIRRQGHFVLAIRNGFCFAFASQGARGIEDQVRDRGDLSRRVRFVFEVDHDVEIG